MTYIEKRLTESFLWRFITKFELLLSNLHAKFWIFSNPVVILSVCLSDIYANKKCEATAFCTYGH
jgi:hypothetical protein